MPLVEPAHIHMDRQAVHRRPGGLFHIFRDAQAGGKIIGGAGGDIAQHRRVLQPHQAVHRLVEGSVAAGAHHQVILFRLSLGDGGQLACPLGDINGRLIARPHKGVHDAQEMAADGLLSRMGVHQKQQLALICHIDHLSVPYFTVCPGKMQ